MNALAIDALNWATALMIQAGGEGWFHNLLEYLKRFEPNMVNFMMLSFLLFIIGVAGVLSRRNIIIIFMSIELILNAVNINLIAFSRYLQASAPALKQKGIEANPLAGPVFTIFIIVVAAAEAAVGLGIVISLFRNRETVSIDEIDLLKW